MGWTRFTESSNQSRKYSSTREFHPGSDGTCKKDAKVYLWELDMLLFVPDTLIGTSQEKAEPEKIGWLIVQLDCSSKAVACSVA